MSNNIDDKFGFNPVNIDGDHILKLKENLKIK